MSYRLGVDVGGTFTDVLLVEEGSGATWRAKTASTPADQAVGVLTGISRACAEAGIELTEVGQVLLGPRAADLLHAQGQGVELVEVEDRGRGQRERGELGLEQRAQLEDPLQLLDAPGGHPGAAVGHELDQALGGQPGQRLAHGGAADPEPRGQVDLGQACPGRDLAAEDHLAQRVDSPLRGRHRPCHSSHLPGDCMQRRAHGFPGTTPGA